MNEFQEYIAKVLWYSTMEYGTEPISVKDFESCADSNLLMDVIFNNFSSNKSFQDCAGSLIRFYKKQKGLPDLSEIKDDEL